MSSWRRTGTRLEWSRADGAVAKGWWSSGCGVRGWGRSWQSRGKAILTVLMARWEQAGTSWILAPDWTQNWTPNALRAGKNPW